MNPSVPEQKNLRARSILRIGMGTTQKAMKRIMKNKVAMYQAVKSVIAANQTVWGNLPAFGMANDEFNTLLDQLWEQSVARQQALMGVTAMKNAVRQEATDKTMYLVNALSAYAVFSNNVELAHQVAVKKNDILRKSKIGALEHMEIVIEKALEHLSGLASFGVDQPRIDELQALHAELEEQFNAPRQAIVERKVLTEKLNDLVHRIDSLLVFRLDRLVAIVSAEAPDFLRTYKAARRVIHIPGKQSAKENPDPERDDGTSAPE